MTRFLALKSIGMAAPFAVAAALAFAQSTIPTGSPGMIAPIFAADRVRIDGTVREIFGNKFILENASGRTLIETGPEGRELVRVAVGDQVTIEGRARDGFTHASAIVLANGRRIVLAGPPGPGPGPAFDQRVVLDAASRAGFSDARIVDVKKRHAEVAANDAAGKPWELHIEFDGRIRKQEAVTGMGEAEVKALLEKAGYAYDGAMRPHKKHMIVQARNSRGERVEVDVHRDGSIKKEKRLFY